MPELIPKAAVLKIIFDSIGKPATEIYQKVRELPGVDAEPVRHGRWIKDGKDGPVYCSECGEEHEWGDYRARYCDTCGAKMSWEREDDE